MSLSQLHRIRAKTFTSAPLLETWQQGVHEQKELQNQIASATAPGEPLGRPRPHAGPAPGRPRPHTGPAPPSSPPALGGSPLPPTGAARGGGAFSRVFPPTPAPGLTCRPDPRRRRPPSRCAAASYPVVRARAASAVWAVAGRTPPPEFCGLKTWLRLLQLFCFDFFGIFPRSLGSGAGAPAVHSGAPPPAASRENFSESWARGGGAEPVTGWAEVASGRKLAVGGLRGGAVGNLWLPSSNSASSIRVVGDTPPPRRVLIWLLPNYFYVVFTVQGR